MMAGFGCVCLMPERTALWLCVLMWWLLLLHGACVPFAGARAREQWNTKYKETPTISRVCALYNYIVGALAAAAATAECMVYYVPCTPREHTHTQFVRTKPHVYTARAYCHGDVCASSKFTHTTYTYYICV